MTTTVPPKPAPAKPRRVGYPTRDGKPMAETDKHREIAVYVIEALKNHYNGRPDVYVSGNNFVSWQEGDPKARVSPDAYVVFGFTSRKTQQEDTDTKLPRYESVLKTPEYFLFDPTGDYLRPRLQGHRLADGRYVRLELADDRLHSEQLGLDLVPWGEELRLYDPAREAFLPTALELNQQAERGARRAERGARRADTAEAEIARLRAELDALRNRDL